MLFQTSRSDPAVLNRYFILWPIRRTFGYVTRSPNNTCARMSNISKMVKFYRQVWKHIIPVYRLRLNTENFHCTWSKHDERLVYFRRISYCRLAKVKTNFRKMKKPSKKAEIQRPRDGIRIAIILVQMHWIP